MIVCIAVLVRREGPAGDLDHGAGIVSAVVAAGERARDRDRAALLDGVRARVGHRENGQFIPDRRAGMSTGTGRRGPFKLCPVCNSRPGCRTSARLR